MSSLYQKAIRRCDVKAAGYAANELFDRYEHYLWKRTLVISLSCPLSLQGVTVIYIFGDFIPVKPLELCQVDRLIQTFGKGRW